MSDQEQQVKPKRKTKSKAKPDVVFELGETFAPSKEEDFDLNLKEMNYQAKKGQAGSRSKSVGGDSPSDSSPSSSDVSSPSSSDVDPARASA